LKGNAVKTLVLSTLIALASGSAVAHADYRGKWEHSQPYSWCEEKARRLHGYEHRSARDGVITREERHTIRALQDDLARSCGGGRWHPDRGWHRR
jgi:hypothetical protein